VSERTTTRSARWARIVHLGSLAILALVILAVIGGAVSGEGGGDPIFVVLIIVLVAGFSTLGRLIVTRAGNVLGWVFLAMGGALALGLPGEGYLDVAFREPYVASLPGTGIAGMTANLFPAVMALAIPMLFLLFPTGAPPTPRWRWVSHAWLVGSVLCLVWLVFRPGSIYGEPNRFSIRNPFGLEFLRPWEPLFLDGGVAIVLAASVAAIVSLIVRFRRARGEERQQIKWLMLVALAAAVILVAMVVEGLLFGEAASDVLWISLVVVLVLGIPSATALAIFRYRLYDVDVVVSKTIAYVTLALGIAAVYVGLVVGIGALIGDTESQTLRIAATALVAVGVQPGWSLLQRVANRIVFGRRATPYEVMAEFGHRMAGVPSADHVLPDMAEAAARGVGARATRVRLFLEEGRTRAATWPPDGDIAEPTLVLGIDHAGEPIGDIAIVKSANDPLRAAERSLLKDLAVHAGIALENARLSLDLETRAEELASRNEELSRSRERLVTVRDAQRRRLEHELREGVGAEIARIRDQIGFDAARVVADPDPVRLSLDHLSERTNAALNDLREVARGIFPPLLVDEGLAAALAALARRGASETRFSSGGSAPAGRYDPAIEAAVYFCCVQAVQNAERHAPGSPVEISLSHDGEGLSFTVRDHGTGFAVGEASEGEGFQIMRDRMAAFGGELTIESAPGEGTTVTGTVPAGVLEVVG
jgi:signal transduction histidine kinase